MQPELRPPEQSSPSPSASKEPFQEPLQEPLQEPFQAPHIHAAAERERNGIDWVFVGQNGLRAGWSILLFYAIYYLLRIVVGTVFYTAGLIGTTAGDSAPALLADELVPLLSLLAAVAIMALVEGRRLASYNLAGPGRGRYLAAGALAGFAAISLLVFAMACCGWLRVAPSATTVAQALRLAALWGCVFLVVASVEEGLFRCYGLSTLARGINFWWALAAQAVICADALIQPHRNGSWGVVLAATPGLVPCFVLHRRSAASPSLALHQESAARSAFWQAAWVTSTVFGLYHTINSGENSVGVFAAAAVGFVFCLSVRLTGSAWWAIGFHAAWDWAETFFYGTADSGLQGQGHLLSARPAGNPLWSGGADGPEGSLLVLGVLVLLAAFLFAVYGRSKAPAHRGSEVVRNAG